MNNQMIQFRMSRVLLWLFIIALSCAYGFLIHRNHVFPYNAVKYCYNGIRAKFTKEKINPPAGMWTKGRNPKRLSQEQREEMEKLAAIGYTSGSTPVTSKKGITVYKKEATFDGLNYYTSGHAPEAILMNMDGQELHKWHLDYDRFWPDSKLKGQIGTTYWRRAHLFENGDVLAIYEGAGLIKVDKDSKLLWGYRALAHHDFEVLPDGSIYVLTREPKILPSINPKEPILEDFITVLDPQGKVKTNLSVVKALEDSTYSSILRNTSMEGDMLHTNTVHVLDGSQESRAPFLKKGNVLISLCKADTIAVVDMTQRKVVWALSGMFRRQHEPVLLPGGRLLLFDNRPEGTRSRVIEFDLFTQQILWSYEAPLFYSPILGSNQRLPNGNTLITESWFGRAFEVTPDDEIVWEFRNPHQAGPKHEFVAVIPEMMRLPSTFPLDWLERR